MNRKREAAREWATATTSEALAKARADEIVPGLRHLGFTADEARRAAEFCGQTPKASIEERFRMALSYLRPKGSRSSLSPAPLTGQSVDALFEHG